MTVNSLDRRRFNVVYRDSYRRFNGGNLILYEHIYRITKIKNYHN